MTKKRIAALVLVLILVSVSSVSMASSIALRAAKGNSLSVYFSLKNGKITATGKATVNNGTDPYVKVYLEKMGSDGQWTTVNTGNGKKGQKVVSASTSATSGKYRAYAKLTVSNCPNGNVTTPYVTYDY